jgi:hypothetical protein
LPTRQRDTAFANGRIEDIGECNDIAQISAAPPTRSAHRHVPVVVAEAMAQQIGEQNGSCGKRTA